jgi:hypothetical protein
MAKIPSHCHSCGAIFASRMISIEGNVKGLTLSNNSETCPYCGGIAYLADGVFNIADDVISILSAPSITKDNLRKLGVAVIDAYKDPSKSENLIKIAESIDPDVANAVRAVTSNKSLALVGLLLFAMAIKSCNLNVSLDANKLIDQLNEEPPQTVDIEIYRI